ncbi:protein of unknown function [Serratia sp. Tan611]|nr:protein of unknown function [Serratia sp. Tan611]
MRISPLSVALQRDVADTLAELGIAPALAQ